LVPPGRGKRERLNVRSLVPCSLMCSLLVCLYPAVCPGQATGITRKHHPWGRFEPGAWKLVHVLTESFDENETLKSTTETRSILEAIEKDGATLRIEVTVKVGGKRFKAEPQSVKQGFHGELVSQELKQTDLGSGEVVIQGQAIPCKILQLELAGPANKTVTKIYYSDTVEPYVLKRESVKTDLESKVPLSETTVNVVALDVPRRILGGIAATAHVKAVHKHAKGTTTTLAVTSMDVPGGVICHTSKQLDESGRLIRRSSLEMIDYGLDVQRDRVGLFHRRRPSRLRPPFRFSPLRWKPLPDGE